MEITLSTVIARNSYGRQSTIAEAVEDLPKTALRLLESWEVDDEYAGFVRAVKTGEVPTYGQLLAGYYVAATDELDEQFYTQQSITSHQYRTRRGAVARKVYKRLPKR